MGLLLAKSQFLFGVNLLLKDNLTVFSFAIRRQRNQQRPLAKQAAKKHLKISPTFF